MSNDLKDEGTILFQLRSDKPGPAAIPTNNRGVDCGAEINADGTISVTISGPFGGPYEFREKIPPAPPGAPTPVSIGITWKNGAVTLFVNGVRLKTRHSPRLQS